MKRKTNKSKLYRWLAGLGLLGVGLGVYGHWIEPYWLEVSRIKVPLHDMDPRMDGFTILQISDVHIMRWMLNGYLAQIVKKANQICPDVIALTGDYVFLNLHRMAPELRKFFSSLEAKQAKVAILGNHDHWEGPGVIRNLLKETGIVDLSNRTIEFSRDGGRLILAGLDDPWERLDEVERVTAMIPDGQKAILLVHEPDYAEKYAVTGKFSIQISGHTHGGQVRIPILGAPVLPEHGDRFSSGKNQVNGMLIYTNRGVGSIPYSFRLNCRPEITLFCFQSAAYRDKQVQ